MNRPAAHRRPPIWPLALAVLALQGCAPALPVPLPADADLSTALVPKVGDTPPALPEGACWHATAIPAVTGTATGQVHATPESGAPAAVRTETRQRTVTDRREAWFRVPCPEILTPDLIASLQRALQARGAFSGPVTARRDGATAAAVRAWQRPRGLDSDVLALATAERFGLVAVPR